MTRSAQDAVPYDLLVLGAGSAGLTAGKLAGLLGLRVAVVEAERPGGDCTWYGCVPSKALLASARLLAHSRRSVEYGLPALVPAAPLDFAAVMRRVRDVQQRIYEREDSPEVLARYGCRLIPGKARFVTPDTVEVDGRRLRAHRFLIATGSQPAMPPIEGIDEAGVLTNETVFALDRLPSPLVVLGAGGTGVELAQAFARLGASVTLVERGEQILPAEEPELTAELQACLGHDGVRVLLSTEARRVARDPSGGLEVTVGGTDGDEVLAADRVLVAVGRRPRVDALGLEAAGISLDGSGSIEVDGALRTTNPRVYACGDVLGRFQFTHVAAEEAVTAVRNAFFPGRSRMRYDRSAWATFTDPELSHVGLTESEARERYGRAVRIYRYPLSRNDRAVAEGATVGQVKLVCHGLRDRVVGAHILGAGAGELIHELTLAVRHGAGARELASTTHVYPTLSEATRFAAQQSLERWARRGWLRAGLGLYLAAWRSLQR